MGGGTYKGHPSVGAARRVDADPAEQTRALTGLDGLGVLMPGVPVDAVESLSGSGIPAR